jgi:hypothetical protein
MVLLACKVFKVFKAKKVKQEFKGQLDQKETKGI